MPVLSSVLAFWNWAWSVAMGKKDAPNKREKLSIVFPTATLDAQLQNASTEDSTGVDAHSIQSIK